MKSHGITVGATYNSITVLGRSATTKPRRNETLWDCRCACGQEIVVRSFRIGRMKSCGCVHRQSKLITAGSRYGLLTAIREAHTNRRGKHFLFACDCGGETVANSRNVASGNTSSCGCIARASALAASSIVRLPFGQSTMKALYSGVKNNAAMRKKPFDLSFEDFCVLTAKPCHYCGEPPRKVVQKKRHGFAFASGLDRVDSSGGYTLGNLLPCCRTCNSAKGEKSVEEFAAWVLRVHSALFTWAIEKSLS